MELGPPKSALLCAVHPEVLGIGARAAPPGDGTVNRFVALTVALQRLVLRTSRPRSVGQRSEFTNNFEMHWLYGRGGFGLERMGAAG